MLNGCARVVEVTALMIDVATCHVCVRIKQSILGVCVDSELASGHVDSLPHNQLWMDVESILLQKEDGTEQEGRKPPPPPPPTGLQTDPVKF